MFVIATRNLITAFIYTQLCGVFPPALQQYTYNNTHTSTAYKGISMSCTVFSFSSNFKYDSNV